MKLPSGYRTNNSDWVMAGRRTGKSKYALLTSFIIERQLKRNTGDVVVYVDFLREEIESYGCSNLSNDDAREVNEALKYLCNKEDLVQDKLIDASMPNLFKAEMLLFKLKSGDFIRD